MDILPLVLATTNADKTAHTALIVSIVSLVLATIIGIAGAISQIVLWRKTGSDVRCEQAFAYPTYGPGDIDRLAAIVSAVNHGRSPAQVVGWGFAFPNGDSVVPTGSDLPNPPFELTLDGGHSTTWYMVSDDLERVAAQRRQLVTAFVRLATGGRVMAPRPVAFN